MSFWGQLGILEGLSMHFVRIIYRHIGFGVVGRGVTGAGIRVSGVGFGAHCLTA